MTKYRIHKLVIYSHCFDTYIVCQSDNGLSDGLCLHEKG